MKIHTSGYVIRTSQLCTRMYGTMYCYIWHCVLVYIYIWHCVLVCTAPCTCTRPCTPALRCNTRKQRISARSVISNNRYNIRYNRYILMVCTRSEAYQFRRQHLDIYVPSAWTSSAYKKSVRIALLRNVGAMV